MSAEAENKGVADATTTPRTRGIRLLVLEHDLYSLPGSLSDWARDRGVTLVEVRTDLGEAIPRPDDFDGVVVLGSVSSVFDDDIQSWFEVEKQRIQEADQSGIPVLGVCFGAQAVASALGGAVSRVERAEIGWTHVESRSPEILDNGPWFQWHHDVITPPPGATTIARNGFSVQAYTLRNNLAVQFHPEITPAVLNLWVNTDASEAVAQGLNPVELVTQTEASYSERKAAAYRLFDQFARTIARERAG